MPYDSAETSGHPRPSRGGTGLLARFEALVSPRVTRADHRRKQAGAIAAMTGAALGLALAAPALVLGGASLLAALSVAALAGLVLLAAAALSGTGEDDLALAILFTAGALALGTLSLRLDTLWPLLLLLLGPGEAMLRGRAVLTRLMLPALLAASALTGFLSLHGLGPAVAGFAGWQAALPLLSAYGASVLFRRGGAARPTVGARPLAVLSPDGGEVDGGRGFGQRLHLLDRILFLKAMDELREGGAACELDLRLLCGDGRAEAARLRLEPQRGLGGGLREVQVLRVDAPPPGHAPAGPAAPAAPVARDQAAFLATVSHELRTPLNAIVGFSEMLDGEVFGPFADPRQREYVALIRRSSQHLLSVVNGLLDMSKIEAGRYELCPERFEPQAVALRAAEMIRGEAERKGLRLVVEAGRPGDSAVADPRACRQIMLNLLANAVKFTDSGSVTLTARIEGASFAITVCDTGIGIAPDDIERLGRPFVQLSQGLARRYEGTGIGLSLVRGLAELHGGAMTIRSAEGRGTTVTVRLPADGAGHASDTPSRNIVALTDARQKTSTPSPASHTTRRHSA